MWLTCVVSVDAVRISLLTLISGLITLLQGSFGKAKSGILMLWPSGVIRSHAKTMCSMQCLQSGGCMIFI